jgi:hypothetical protein
MQSYCEQMMHQAFHQAEVAAADLMTAAGWWHRQRSVGCDPLSQPTGKNVPVPPVVVVTHGAWRVSL